MRTLPLAWRAARAERGLLVALGLLVLLTSFAAAAAPRALTASYDHAARDYVTGAHNSDTDLVVTFSLSSLRQHSPAADAGGLDDLADRWAGRFPPVLRDTLTGRDHKAATDGLRPRGRPHQRLTVELSATAGRHIRYVAGGSPEKVARSHGALRIDVALARKAAQKIDVEVGDVLVLGPGAKAPGVRVSGLYRPTDPTSDYWSAHRDLRTAREVHTLFEGNLIYADALLAPSGYAALYRQTSFPLKFSWTYSPAASRFAAGHVADLTDAVRHADESLAATTIGGEPVDLTTRLDDVLEDFQHRLNTARTVISLALAGLFAAALGVLILMAWLLLDRMRPVLAVQAARGAAPRQTALVAGGCAAIGALPAVLLGYLGAAFTVSGPRQALSPLAVVLVAVVAIVLPATVAAVRARGGDRNGRADPATLRLSPRRLVIEGLVVVLAVVGTYLLRRRGLSTAADRGVDPLLSTVPVLLAAALGLIALRAYPFPLRLLGRATARGRSAAAFIGVARAARRPGVTVLPVIVVLLTTSTAAFGMTVAASLNRAQRDAAWHAVGGDARVASITGIDPTAVDRIRRVAGVTGAVPVRILDGIRLNSDATPVKTVSAVAVDLDAYRELTEGTPIRLPSAPEGSKAPALLSNDIPATATGGDLTVDWGSVLPIPIHRAGTIDDFPTLEGAFLVVPFDALTSLTTKPPITSVFVRGEHIDTDALRRASGASDAVVTTYADTHQRISSAGLAHLVRVGFIAAIMPASCYCALTILLGLIAGAPARARIIGRLRALGLSRWQARRLALLELSPVVGIAVVAGWALGLALPYIVGSAIDLRPYTGGEPVERYTIDAVWTAVIVGGLLVLAVPAVAVGTRFGPRRGTGDILKAGERM